MPSLDDEIDALYRLPLAEFVAARNALARRAGDRAAAVKGLARPATAAWAVNQLYWRRRGVFDALVRASEASRQAQLKALAGGQVDVARAEARHRRALDAAVEAAVTFLRAAGDPVSSATLGALTATLEAVPTPEVNGRLARPIQAVGFGLLAGLLGGTGADPADRRPAEVVPFERARRARAARLAADDDAPGVPRRRAQEPSREPPATRDVERARRAAEARRVTRERLQTALAEADGRARAAAAALERLTRARESAERRVHELRTELRDAEKRLSARRREVQRARQEANAAAREQATLARKLAALDTDRGDGRRRGS